MPRKVRVKVPGIRITTGSVYDSGGGGLHRISRPRYARLRERWLETSKRHGTDRRKRFMWQEKKEVSTELEKGVKYSPSHLDAVADAILREDARAELCRECGKKGDPTGESKLMEQAAQDEAGNILILEFSELKCEGDHAWFEGEGRIKGIGGDNPILFEEHIYSRRRREIYTAVGMPDPSIVQGLYNRTHPQGRKVNSPEQRKKNGASYYR